MKYSLVFYFEKVFTPIPLIFDYAGISYIPPCTYLSTGIALRIKNVLLIPNVIYAIHPNNNFPYWTYFLWGELYFYQPQPVPPMGVILKYILALIWWHACNASPLRLY